MALKHIYGNGTEGFQAIAIPSDSGTTVTFGPFNIGDFDDVGVQLIGFVQGREIEVNTGLSDGVVAGTKTWTLHNATFVPGDVGGSLVVLGTASNDGTYTIASRVSAHVITTSQSPAGNETFGASALFWVTDAGVDPLAGTWAVQVSNDYTPAASGLDYSQDSGFRGRWTDITTQFSPAIAAMTATTGIASTTGQYVQANPLCVRSVRFKFAPDGSSGGTAIVKLCAKSKS